MSIPTSLLHYGSVMLPFTGERDPPRGGDATAPDETRPVARVSPWFGYSSLDPADLAEIDGLVFVKDVRQQPVPR
jgi:hypothetical protein